MSAAAVFTLDKGDARFNNSAARDSCLYQGDRGAGWARRKSQRSQPKALLGWHLVAV